MGKKGSKYLLQDGGGAGQGEDGGDPGPPPKAEVAFDDFDVLRAIGRGAFGKVSALYHEHSNLQLIPPKNRSVIPCFSNKRHKKYVLLPHLRGVQSVKISNIIILRPPFPQVNFGPRSANK